MRIDYLNEPLRQSKSMARYLICGSREFQDVSKLHRFLTVLPCPKAVISGVAEGADLLSVQWVQKNWPSAEVCRFPIRKEDYHRYGRGAGPVRNRQMAVEGKPTLILAFPANPSKISQGTKSMINIGVELKIPTYYAGEKEWVQVFTPIR